MAALSAASSIATCILMLILMAGNNVRSVLIANMNMDRTIAASRVREALIKCPRHSHGCPSLN
jgi:hypothetical protein